MTGSVTRVERKTALTFEERITAAFMHYVRGIDQQDIAIMMGGVNAGRVNEACRAISIALGNEPGVNKAIPSMFKGAERQEDPINRGGGGMLAQRLE